MLLKEQKDSRSICCYAAEGWLQLVTRDWRPVGEALVSTQQDYCNIHLFIFAFLQVLSSTFFFLLLWTSCVYVSHSWWFSRGRETSSGLVLLFLIISAFPHFVLVFHIFSFHILRLYLFFFLLAVSQLTQTSSLEEIWVFSLALKEHGSLV
jgi:4-amino-4-deoxy-L-arabinose transferase-like glycosyltransferase